MGASGALSPSGGPHSTRTGAIGFAANGYPQACRIGGAEGRAWRLQDGSRTRCAHVSTTGCRAGRRRRARTSPPPSGRASEGGKRFRPFLVSAVHGCLGGSRPDAVAAVGAAVELLHTAFVVHDDVIDGDAVRRGRPSIPAWFEASAARAGTDPARARTYGLAGAILTGDLALAAAVRAVATAPAPPVRHHADARPGRARPRRHRGGRAGRRPLRHPRRDAVAGPGPRRRGAQDRGLLVRPARCSSARSSPTPPRTTSRRWPASGATSGWPSSCATTSTASSATSG